MKLIPFDDYNHRMHPGTEIVGTVLPTWGNHALANGWKLIEIYEDATDGEGLLVERPVRGGLVGISAECQPGFQ